MDLDALDTHSREGFQSERHRVGDCLFDGVDVHPDLQYDKNLDIHEVVNGRDLDAFAGLVPAPERRNVVA